MLTVMNIFTLVLALNALWFGAAFNFFSLQSRKAAKILTPYSERENILFPTLVWSVKFLGGMNLALSALAVVLLFSREIFPDARQHCIFAVIFALAHGTQFAFNLPLALAERKAQQPLWKVLSGPMLFIFIVDATLTVANLCCAVALFNR